MNAKLILVTGATDGIGRQTALMLLRQGHEVIIHGRSASKLQQVAQELEQQTGRSVYAQHLADLSEPEQVEQLADEVLRQHERLDVLLNNAGVFMREYKTNAHQQELTFAINHLAPFILTHRLLPLLKATPGARIVNVSSIAHARGKIYFDDLNMSAGFDGYKAYAQSKLANVLFTVALAARLKGDDVTVNALHPGVVSTKLLTKGFGFEGPDSLEDGSQTSVYLATSQDAAHHSGDYFVDCKPAKTSELAQDAQLVERFYQESAALTGIAPLPR